MQTPEKKLLDEILERLKDSSYKPYGEPESDAWGSAQWVELTDSEGNQQYFRIQILRFE